MATKKKPIERTKKCRHRRKILLAFVNCVEFTPDSEPFTSGVKEDSGISAILVDLTMHYCVRCKKILSVSSENEPTVEENFRCRR